MKPSHIEREKERIAKMRLRRWARRIPDNAALINILSSFPEKPFRVEFLRQVSPHLRFTPAVSLEAVDNG